MIDLEALAEEITDLRNVVDNLSTTVDDLGHRIETLEMDDYLDNRIERIEDALQEVSNVLDQS